MQINVAQLFKDPVGSTREYDLNETVKYGEDSYEVCGEITLLRTGRGVLVKGTLNTGIEVNCSRCLCLFSCPLTLSIEEEYLPTVDIVSGTSLNVSKEPGYFTIDEQYVLDLTEAVHQYAMMAIPMKPLCHEGCAGICPTCGQNLNRGACGCPPLEVDSRWSELSKLTLDNDK